ncbi:hypothetical protein ACFLSA_04815 [Bacteroidota bacterium]
MYLLNEKAVELTFTRGKAKEISECSWNKITVKGMYSKVAR